MNNVRRASGTDERQRCQHTSSIRAGSPSITRAPQLRPTPSKHITKARDYFWKHDSTTAAMRRRERGGRAHSHKNNTASAASSLWRHEQLSAFLPSLCRRACWRHRPPVAEIFWQRTSQLANMLLPIATSDLAVWGVKSHLTALSIYFRFFFSLSLCLIHCFLMYPTQRLAYIQDKLVHRPRDLIRPSPSLPQ